jgi:hypothetical protein
MEDLKKNDNYKNINSNTILLNNKVIEPKKKRKYVKKKDKEQSMKIKIDKQPITVFFS